MHWGRHIPQADTLPGQTSPQADTTPQGDTTPHGDTPLRRPMKRTVSIILECILVCLGKLKYRIYRPILTQNTTLSLICVCVLYFSLRKYMRNQKITISDISSPGRDRQTQKSLCSLRLCNYTESLPRMTRNSPVRDTEPGWLKRDGSEHQRGSYLQLVLFVRKYEIIADDDRTLWFVI